MSSLLRIRSPDPSPTLGEYAINMDGESVKLVLREQNMQVTVFVVGFMQELLPKASLRRDPSFKMSRTLMRFSSLLQHL